MAAAVAVAVPAPAPFAASTLAAQNGVHKAGRQATVRRVRLPPLVSLGSFRGGGGGTSRVAPVDPLHGWQAEDDMESAA